MGDRPAARVPVIRDVIHLNALIEGAEGDRDLLAIKRRAQKQGLDTDSIPQFEGLKRGGAAQADDANTLTREDWDAAANWWKESQHRGVHYVQPQIKGRPPRGSFTIPDDVVNQLGDGDPHTAGMVLHGMFGLAPYTGEGDPRVIDPDVVLHVGHGSASAGQKVLNRFVQMLRRQGAQAHDDYLQPDGTRPARVIR